MATWDVHSVTPEARFRPQIGPCGVYDRQMTLGVGFHMVQTFPDLRSSYVLEVLAEVEFCARHTSLYIRSTLYVHLRESS
jgi:hypothetical protein